MANKTFVLNPFRSEMTCHVIFISIESIETGKTTLKINGSKPKPVWLRAEHMDEG